MARFSLGEEGFAALPGWIKHHEPDKAFEDTKPLLETLKSKGISAVGAVGFCYGAKAVFELSNHDLIQAAAMCHPAFVTLDDSKAVKVPTQILGAEIDHMSPPEVVKQFEEALAAKPEIKSHVKIFPKVEHGWTTRYNDEDEAACKAADEAYQDLLKRTMVSVDPEELKRAGNEKYRRGHFAEALSLYDRAIALSPANAAYRSNRAVALTGLRRLTEAAREYEKAMRLDPNYGRAHQRLGSSFLRLGQVENSKRHLSFPGLQPDPAELQKLQAVEKYLKKNVQIPVNTSPDRSSKLDLVPSMAEAPVLRSPLQLPILSSLLHHGCDL
ncbi:hypothetical protein ACFX2C_044140 [Malus domestica]